MYIMDLTGVDDWNDTNVIMGVKLDVVSFYFRPILDVR